MLEVNYEEGTLTITNSSQESKSETKPLLFIKPSEDLGDLEKIRKFTPERDYLDALRYADINVEFVSDQRSYTINFETGANYSTGIPVKLDVDGKSAKLNAGEIVTLDVTFNDNMDRSYRFKFEVI